MTLLQATSRRRSGPWRSYYRKYVRAIIKEGMIDFVVEAKRTDTRLNVYSALIESVKNEKIVEKILEPPALDPFVVRVKIREKVPYRALERFIEKYSSYSYYAI